MVDSAAAPATTPSPPDGSPPANPEDFNRCWVCIPDYVGGTLSYDGSYLDCGECSSKTILLLVVPDAATSLPMWFLHTRKSQINDKAVVVVSFLLDRSCCLSHGS